jgi:hypothetical protein
MIMKRTMAAELAARKKIPSVDGARTRLNNRPMPPEQVHVVDRIRAGDHASHQRRHLDPELAPWSPDSLRGSPGQPISS